MTRLGDALRVRNWWFSKIPPLVAIVYLEILGLDIGGLKAISLLVAFLWSVMCVASYGHVINDIFDVHPGVPLLSGSCSAFVRSRPWHLSDTALPK